MAKKKQANQSKKAKKDLYQDVTDRILEAFDAGVKPWVKPWTNREFDFPHNPFSRRSYNGVNALLLWLEATEKGYESNAWATFKQVQDAGGHVKKGEKGTQVVLFKPLKIKQENEDGETEEKKIPLIRYYTVFNADQCQDLEIHSDKEPKTPKGRIEEAEERIEAWGANVRFAGSRAFYHSLEDYIQVPKMNSFKTSEGYYATLYHEHVHWTGHKTRLDRQLDQSRFGDEAYAFEELVAEIGAAFLCAETGITSTLENHASYLEGWKKVLREDSKAIFTASSQARKACEFLTTLEG